MKERRPTKLAVATASLLVLSGCRTVKGVAGVMKISQQHAHRLLVKAGCVKIWVAQGELSQ